MKKNVLFLTARDSLVKEVSSSKIKATKGELKGYLDFVKESSAFIDDLTLEDFERQHAKGRLSKSKLESIKKGLNLKDKLMKQDNRLGTGEGLFDLMVENTWRNNPHLQEIVEEVLYSAGNKENKIMRIPSRDSNNMFNDDQIISYANQLGVDKQEFINHLLHGVYSGKYKP